MDYEVEIKTYYNSTEVRYEIRSWNSLKYQEKKSIHKHSRVKFKLFNDNKI